MVLYIQAPTLVSELTYYAWQVVYNFYLPDIISGLREISYNICLNVMYYFS